MILNLRRQSQYLISKHLFLIESSLCDLIRREPRILCICSGIVQRRDDVAIAGGLARVRAQEVARGRGS